MISNKLLSEILFDGKYILEVDEVVNEATILVRDEDEDEISEFINIYELAHKCKEWAYKRDTALISGMDYIDKSCFCNIWETDGIKFTVRGDTEPESIFKACQYILDK